MEELQKALKVPLSADGFFMEAHAKLGYLEVNDNVTLDDIKKNSGLKKKKFAATAEARKSDGKYVPKYD